MKKRLKARYNKTYLLQRIIKPLKRRGYHVKYDFSCGYYLFNFGKNTVLSFEIEELPELKFGVWNTKTKQYFAEYIPKIDKFKPTAVTYRWNSDSEMLNFIEDFKKNKYEFLRRDYSFLKWPTNEELDEEFQKDLQEILESEKHNFLNEKEWKECKQTMDNLIDKAKKDSRIIGIYEIEPIFAFKCCDLRFIPRMDLNDEEYQNLLNEYDWEYNEELRNNKIVSLVVDRFNTIKCHFYRKKGYFHLKKGLWHKYVRIN